MLDSVTLIWHKVSTLKKCESNGPDRKVPARSALGRGEVGERMAEETRIGGRGARVQLRKVDPRTWTQRKRRIFFAHLAATCNVKAAAKAAGMGLSGAYLRYHAEPAFAAAWEEALAIGRRHLNALLLARSMGTGTALTEDRPDAPEEEDPPLPDPEAMDTDLALRLLAMHSRPAGAQNQSATSGRVRMASDHELTEALTKAIGTLQRREARGGRKG